MVGLSLRRSYRVACLATFLSAMALAGCTSFQFSFVSPAPAPQEAAAAATPGILSDDITPCRFVTCIAAAGDKVWAGTEDQGLWCVDLASNPLQRQAWWPFEVGREPGPKQITDVASDSLGRIWFGTACDGVGVFNGKEYKNYGVVEGCSGQHVYAIAADLKGGDVWIGTEGGLTRFTNAKEGARAWVTYTRLDGLPSDQVTAVHVAAGGRVWIGTDCSGMAWSDPPYGKWTRVTGAGLPAPEGLKLAVTAGLPSDMINAITTLPDGTVAVATPAGIGLGFGGGAAWITWRGMAEAPYLNYACTVAADRSGALWIGTREKGLVRLDVRTGDLKFFDRPAAAARQAPDKPHGWGFDDFVKGVAVADDGTVWTGSYGAGLARMPAAAPGGPWTRAVKHPAETSRLYTEWQGPPPPPLPVAAPAPTGGDLGAMMDLVQGVRAAAGDAPTLVRVADDWLTRGDWLGRYGRYWACTCGTCAPGDYEWGGAPQPVIHHAQIGPGFEDSLRYWVQWLHTDNVNTLEMPPTYFSSRVMKGFQTAELPRRASEWNDHGYSHPRTEDGPDLYCTVKVPAGVYYLSLYFNNKDGHQGTNTMRDWRVSVRRPPAEGERDIWDLKDFWQWPEVASARAADTWNGAWKRFLVRGPQEVVVRVARNHSVDTLMEGVMLDLVDELPMPYYHTQEQWQKLPAIREAEAAAAAARAAALGLAPAAPGDSADALFDEVERLRLRNPQWWAQYARPIYAALARTYAGRTGGENPGNENKGDLTRLATCYYQLGLYAWWEGALARVGMTSAREIEKALRWDGHTASFEGKGYEVIRAHVEGRPAKVE